MSRWWRQGPGRRFPSLWDAPDRLRELSTHPHPLKPFSLQAVEQARVHDVGRTPQAAHEDFRCQGLAGGRAAGEEHDRSASLRRAPQDREQKPFRWPTLAQRVLQHAIQRAVARLHMGGEQQQQNSALQRREVRRRRRGHRPRGGPGQAGRRPCASHPSIGFTPIVKPGDIQTVMGRRGLRSDVSGGGANTNRLGRRGGRVDRERAAPSIGRPAHLRRSRSACLEPCPGQRG